MAFFDRYFPVLGTQFGLGALGIFQCLISTQILSHHVDDFTLVSAFFLFALGCVNMLLGLIWRESAKHRRALMAWRGESVLPSVRDMRVPFARPASGFVAGLFGKHHASSDDTAHLEKGNGFSHEGQKNANLKGTSRDFCACASVLS